MRGIWFLVILFAAGAAGGADVDVPLTIDTPATAKAESWPDRGRALRPRHMQGDRPAARRRCRGPGGPQPDRQDRRVGIDEPLRWVLVDFQPRLAEHYSVVTGAHGPARADDIKIEQSPDGITVNTGAAAYKFRKGQGCFDELKLAGASAPLVSGAGGAFYVIDSKDRLGMMRTAGLPRVELVGPRHAVIRTEGDYLTQDGKRNAAGVVYFHFYAGLPWCRISHKLIVTEETLALWFRDIGVRCPLALRNPVHATFNNDHDNPAGTFVQPLPLASGAWMTQSVFPHFGQSESRFTIQSSRDKPNESFTAFTGKSAGDWRTRPTQARPRGADARLRRAVPHRAARVRFRADRQILGHGIGKEIDFRTEQIVKNYFGEDWIPAGSKIAALPNTAKGSARTHEFWLYPHTGKLTPEISRAFAATKDEIYAFVDPAYLGADRRDGPFSAVRPREISRRRGGDPGLLHQARDAAGEDISEHGLSGVGAEPVHGGGVGAKNGHWWSAAASAEPVPGIRPEARGMGVVRAERAADVPRLCAAVHAVSGRFSDLEFRHADQAEGLVHPVGLLAPVFLGSVLAGAVAGGFAAGVGGGGDPARGSPGGDGQRGCAGWGTGRART